MLKFSRKNSSKEDFLMIQLTDIHDSKSKHELANNNGIFVDVKMLLTKIRETHPDGRRSLMSIPPPNLILKRIQNQDKKEQLQSGRFTELREIHRHLTGYGRLTYFTSSIKGKSRSYNPLISKKENVIVRWIEEGEFVNGKLNGFGRIYDREQNCQIGFFKNGHPHGKLQKY